MKKVLISGAGIAGLTVAYWLRKYGFEPTLVERYPALQKGGYKIDIRGSALQVVKQMGIYPAILEAKTDIRGATYVDSAGQQLTTMAGDLYGLRSGEDLEIVRGDLCQILFDQLDGIECLFGDSITSIRDNYVEFNQAKPRQFDLIIGADGLHSTVRKLVFGEESQFLHHLGIYVSVFTIPNFLHLDRWEIEYKEPTQFVNVYCTKGSADAKACFAFLGNSTSFPRNREEQQKILETQFSKSGWETARLLQEMRLSRDFYFDAAAQIKIPSWSKGRVVLLGDAGYAPAPMSGLGTSVALIGAYILAGELSEDYAHAFDRYDALLRPFVEKNQKLARFGVEMMQPAEASFSSWLIHTLCRILPSRLIQFLSKIRLNQIAKIAKSISLKTYSN